MTKTTHSRRQFLRLSLLTPFAVTASTAYLSGCATSARRPDKPLQDTHFHFLDEDSAQIWQAIITVMIVTDTGDSPSTDEVSLHISRIDQGLRHFSPANREKVSDLFNLLSITFTRGLTTGIWQPWPNATHSDIRQFLDAWKNSRFQVFNQGYNVLAQLAAFTYYGEPEHWEESGYPGPPKEIKAALPQFKSQEIAG
ncbi:hypothetical protein [Hahella ganghwensis]|uniref:hypothetical protein n=1 Tax=Hahella ganghwensis TaxID=286420 RepID=UPI000363B721|nr:hypothetical protein [Hahella ganghwensis]